MGSKLVYWLTDSLLITGETLPESLSAQTRNTAADFLCALSWFQCTLGFLGREVGPAPLQHPTRQRVLTHPNCCPPRRLEQRLSRDPSGKSWPVWTPLSVWLPGGVMVRKLTPKRNHHFHQTCRLVFLARISDCCHSREHQLCHGESQTSYHFFWHESSHVTCKRVDVNCMSWALALHKNKSL